MSDLDDIWHEERDSGEGLPEDKLMAYLEGRLPAEEVREVELWLAKEGMESDAVEGLQQLSPGETKHTVSRLKHKLRRGLAGKKHKRRKTVIENKWAIIAIITVLLLAILAYIAIRISIRR